MPIRHLFKPVRLIFAGKSEIGPSAWAFNFSYLKPLSWRAGQHGILEITLVNGKTARKVFSIASAPSEGVVTIATKIPIDHIDEFKQTLLKMKRGTPAKLYGPVGSMHIKNHSHSYAFLATGIGITAFRSILKQLELENRVDTKITLFYVGSSESHYFKDELNKIKSALDNVSIEYIYQPERITGQVLEEKLGKDLYQTVFFLAGSPNMIRSYRRTLQGLGITRKYIKYNSILNIKSRLPKFSASPKISD
jgi:ferredoxin-NADP reductase